MSEDPGRQRNGRTYRLQMPRRHCDDEALDLAFGTHLQVMGDRLDVPVAKILGARRYRQKREVYECHKVVAQALGEEIAVGLIHWVSLSFLVGVLCLD